MAMAKAIYSDMKWIKPQNHVINNPSLYRFIE